MSTWNKRFTPLQLPPSVSSNPEGSKFYSLLWVRCWLGYCVKGSVSMRAGRMGFHHRQGQISFSLRSRVQTTSEAQSASYQVITGGFLPKDKAAGSWSYTSTPYVFMAWCLVKHRGIFTHYKALAKLKEDPTSAPLRSECITLVKKLFMTLTSLDITHWGKKLSYPCA
jgi:hypothetical protein